jgi:hypothetical protein
MGKPVDVPLLQVSNPCWYRYQILDLPQTTTQAQARVRVYEHFWSGDNGGGLPKSWEQEIGLLNSNSGWRVDQLSAEKNVRTEPDEPHGPTLSACNATRLTPTNAKP